MPEKLKVLDLFSGIGGFSLGLERTGGFSTVAFCEIESFPQKVLRKHWPEVPIYEDVRKLTAERLHRDGIFPNFISAGFPCQDASAANPGGQGTKGERTGLFSEAVRLVDELEPCGVLLENVANLLNRGFGDILAALAQIGYDAEWDCIPSSFVGAWHKRDRVWVLAYPGCKRNGKGKPKEQILRQSHLSREPSRVFAKWPGRSNLSGPTLHRGANGLSRELDSHGNAVVPQIPELIGHAILESEKEA